MKKTYILILLFFISATVFSQTPPSEILTNESVLAMAKAGLPSSVIVTTIKNSKTNFNVTTAELIKLKNQNLSEEVLNAMINGGQPNSAEKSTGVASLDPGIYYIDPVTSATSPVEASVFSQAKVGSGILTSLTYGIAKTKSKAVLTGPQANFHINNNAPSFYFIFPHTGGGSLGNESYGWYSNATSPNEFLLIKFNTSKKSRDVVTGSFGTYSGFSGGIEEKSKVPYRFEKISSGVYKVKLDAPLPVGEYAFIFAGSAATTGVGGGAMQKAFDFSIVK